MQGSDSLRRGEWSCELTELVVFLDLESIDRSGPGLSCCFGFEGKFVENEMKWIRIIV
jgi:hypothetical protein